LNERFGESNECFEGSRQDMGTLGEMDEVGTIGATSKKYYLVETLDEVTRQSYLLTPKAIGLHYEVEGILQEHMTPQIQETHSIGEGPNPNFLTLLAPSANLLISTINISIGSVVSNPSSLESSRNSSSSTVESVLVISQLGPSRFILIGSPSSLMENQHARSLT
jgi:hypothetical protein